MTPGTQSYPPARPGQQQGAVYDWNKGGASFGRIGLRNGVSQARPPVLYQGKPGQAQPMRPQSGGTPYAPANRPSIGGWPDPAGSGQRPRQPPMRAEGRYGPGTTQAYMEANPDTVDFGGNGQPERRTTRPNYVPHTRPFLGPPLVAWDSPMNPSGPNYNPQYQGASYGGFAGDGGAPPMHDSNGNGVDDRLERMGGGGQVPASPYGSQPDPFTFGFSGGKQATTAPSVQKGAGAGNLAYASPENRPQPFTQSVSFMGQQMDPSQYYGQRDAFISNINTERAKFAQNPTEQRQPLNFGAMWGQAGDMVGQGWQNPLQGLYR